MTTSYHNDPSLKARFVGHIERHRELDMIRKGTYGHMSEGAEFKGCAVGCSLRSLNEIDGEVTATGDHAALARRLGIPLVLARLEDRIFEGLPEKEALLWPTLFAQAIPVGADLSLVWPKFARWMLADEKAGVIQFCRSERSREAVTRVAELFGRQVAGETVLLAEWGAARSNAAAYANAAYAAAYANAAYAAAYANAAYAAAYAANAANAANAAAYAANAANAAYAARERHYQLMADALLVFMASSPVVSP